MGRVAAGLLLTLLLLVSPGLLRAAGELDASRRELGEVQRRIEETLGALRSKRSAAGTVSAELQRLEQSLSRLRELIRASDLRLAGIDLRLAEEQGELQRLQRELDETRRVLGLRLAAMYKGGGEGSARALLSRAATPLELAERYTFMARIARHDRALADAYRQQAEAVEQALAELGRLREEQSALAGQRRAEQGTLQAAGKAKQQLLTELRRDQASLSVALKELRARAARLSELVKKLERAKSTFAGKPTEFTAQRGRLVWPVNGRVRIGFGATRHPELGTMIDSNGLEIAVAPQSPVKSIWKGRVLYAGALKGFGNLLIIDHGDKYYSLYAHAASFKCKVGDVVAAGEVIALSGHAGRDALYFEIRHQGVPINPLPWLAPR